MDAKGALFRLALGTMMAATLWVGGPATICGAQEYGEWRSAEGSAAAPTGTVPAGEEAMQPIYQGTQQVVAFFGREIDAAMSQAIALLQNLARGKVSPADKYALAWGSKERYPVAISPLTHTVGLTKEEIQYLTKRGTWVTVREAGRERVILAAVHSPGSNAIISVAVPLAKFTGSLDPFRVGQDGRIFVIDAAGNVLNNPGRRLNVDRDALLRMLGDELGTLETRSAILSFSKVPSADWYTLIEVPKAEARNGLVFPSDTQMRMSLQLEPPSEVVRERDWSALALPGLATLLLLGLGGAMAPWLAGRRRRGKKHRAKSALGGDQPAFDLDNLDNPPEKALLNLDRDKLGKASKNWASDELMLPEPKADLASATRMKMAMRQQSRDQERMLQQLQHSLELTISETRDQIHEVLNAHQGKIKALTAALEQTRNNLLFKADGEALAALVDDLKTKLFQAEADQRQASVGVEKRLSTLSRRVGDLDSTLGKAVAELQEKLSDDLLGRQESITRAMESLEAKTREAQRQLTHDAAAAKLSAAQAAEQASTLDAEFQELKTKAALDVEDARRQAAADVAAVRAQVAQMDDLRAELKDSVARFQSSQIEWEENARTLSRRVNDELISLQQRIFDREGDVEKLRILVDQASGHVNKAREDFDIRRERIERDLDTLKGKLYLSEEELERFRTDAFRRLDELAAASEGHAEQLASLDGRLGMAHLQMDQHLGEMRQDIGAQGLRIDEAARQSAEEHSRLLEDLERRFAAHVAETERRTSEAVAEALASAMAAIARVDASRADGEAGLKADIVSAFEKAEDVAARAERARARLEDKLLDDQKALEDRLMAQQRQALDRLGEMQAELQMGHEAFRNELQAGRDRIALRLDEFGDKIAHVEVREAQERTRLEDQLKSDFQALHQDLAGRHLALREELVAAQEVFQADVRDEWLAGRQEDLDKVREEAAWARSQEAQTRESALEAIREVVAALGQEVRQQADAHRQTVAAELAAYREGQTQHQAHLEQALGELARKVSADLGAAKEREDSLTGRVSSVETQVATGLESLHTQLMQEAATAQEIIRRLDSRLADLTESAASRFEDLAQKSEHLVASAIAALPDHPEVIGLHREVEHLHQEAYRGREDLDQLRDLSERNMRDLSERNNEQYTKLTSLVQMLLKLYQNARETDERVTKVLSSQQHKVEGLHQEVLAIRSMVITKPGPLAAHPAGGAPTPLL